MAFLQEQIRSQGREAHPLKGAFSYDLNEEMEIVIEKMPDDPHGLDWSQLQTIVNGLWQYVVAGMRYRTVSFDILNAEDESQIAWGQLVKWESGSLSDRTAKRGVQLSKPPSSGDLDPGPGSLGLSTPLGAPIDWPVKDSDMTLRFSTFGSAPHNLDRGVVRNLLRDLIGVIDRETAAHGEEALFHAETFLYGRSVMLEVMNWRHMLTWGHLGKIVLGLVDFMVDHEHYHSYYFSVLVQNPRMEIGLGIIT